jgi:hypothetical protein
VTRKRQIGGPFDKTSMSSVEPLLVVSEVELQDMRMGTEAEITN